jgi:hypothetical protein
VRHRAGGIGAKHFIECPDGSAELEGMEQRYRPVESAGDFRTARGSEVNRSDGVAACRGVPRMIL